MAARGYDYIIIGSGVAGSTVAKALLGAEPRMSVLILEAGPTVPMKDRRSWWDYIINRNKGFKPYDDCEDRDVDNASVGATPWHSRGSRTIMYGGSTVHWGGWSLRFKPEDFVLKSNTGRGGDWPYGYETLEPYYCRAEDLLSVCGADDDPWRSKPYPLPPYPFTESDGEMIQALTNLGLAWNAMPLARYRKCMATGSCKYCPFGARYSASYVMDELLSEPAYTNLQFLGMAPATRLIADNKAKIGAVEYRDPQSGELKVVHGDRIIVCSGAYEVPKLLQASTSDHWKQGIGNDYDLVGRFPVSHPFLSVQGTLRRNEEGWAQQYDFPSLMSRAFDNPENQANGKLFMMKSASVPGIDIAQLMIDGRSRTEIEKCIYGSRKVQLSAFMEEMGQCRNRFTIGEGTTRFGLPRTRITFSHPKDFRERAFRNIEKMTMVIREMGYEIDTRVAGPEHPDGFPNEVDRQIGTQDGHHTCSTSRMGRDESEGVVDADLKVFGTDNLYVCSNAVLPNCAAVNPTLTLVAVTLKLTDHLLSGAAP